MEDRDLELYQRGDFWWVRGHRPDTGEYIRESLETRDEVVAEAKVEEIYKAARNRRVLGPDAPKPEDELIFAAASEWYDPPSEREAGYLVPILRREGKTRVKDMTPAYVRKVAKDMLPYESTDTWMREVVTPIRSVINNAHELGKCPPIRVKAFSKAERVKQDLVRGKQSRVPREPGSWPWVLAFVEAANELGKPRYGALAYFMFRHGYRITQSITPTRSKDLNLQAAKLRVGASKGHPAHWVILDPEEVAMIANLPVPYRGKAKDRVFTIGGGRSGGLYRDWKAICKHADITYLPPHSAGRHGYGTEMVVRRRVDPISAAEDKWSNPSVMLKTYSHSGDAAGTVRDAFMEGLQEAKATRRTPGVHAKSEVSLKAAGGKGTQ